MNKQKVREIIGSEIRKIRKEKHITQAQLSEKTGIGRTAITKYELGLIELSMPQFINICDALGVDYAEFFDRIEIYE